MVFKLWLYKNDKTYGVFVALFNNSGFNSREICLWAGGGNFGTEDTPPAIHLSSTGQEWTEEAPPTKLLRHNHPPVAFIGQL